VFINPVTAYINQVQAITKQVDALYKWGSGYHKLVLYSGRLLLAFTKKMKAIFRKM